MTKIKKICYKQKLFIIRICQNNKDKVYEVICTGKIDTARQIINIYELRPEIEEDFKSSKFLIRS